MRNYYCLLSSTVVLMTNGNAFFFRNNQLNLFQKLSFTHLTSEFKNYYLSKIKFLKYFYFICTLKFLMLHTY